MARPIFGLGYQWLTEKHTDYTYSEWRSRWGTEAMFGIAVPFYGGSDLLIQYTVIGKLKIENGKIINGDSQDYLMLGYRFNVFD